MSVTSVPLRFLYAIPQGGVTVRHRGDRIAIDYPPDAPCTLVLRGNVEGDLAFPLERLDHCTLRFAHRAERAIAVRLSARDDGWLMSHTELWTDAELAPGDDVELQLDTRDFRIAQQEPASSVALKLTWTAPSAGHLELTGIDLAEMTGADYFAARVDRFGQRIAGDWPGKVGDEAELAADADRPAGEPAPGRDRYGAERPDAVAADAEGDGFFTLERTDSTWHLRSPTGGRFLSFGPCCWSAGPLHTRTAGIEELFQDLPPHTGPLGKAWRGAPAGTTCYPEVYPARSYGHDPDSTVVNHYIANLVRKYGEDWHAPWSRHNAERLRAWGMNTAACWSDLDAIAATGMPYMLPADRVSTVDLDDLLAPKGSGFPLTRIPDVFHPEFERRTADWFHELERFRDDRNLLGYFVGNEEKWCFWHSPFAFPAAWTTRRVFVRELEERYRDIATLNAAWNTGFLSFAHLDGYHANANPPGMSDEGTAICDDFMRRFADRYFARVRERLQAVDPHHLFWGCRFLALPPRQCLLDGICPHCDIVSINWYLWHKQRNEDVPDFLGDWHRRAGGKPLAITEYSFEVTDGRLQASRKLCTSRTERAAQAADFTRRCFELPFLIGCHWFQYVDEPICGRALSDGERASFGFVDITDREDPELVTAMTGVGRALYDIHPR